MRELLLLTFRLLGVQRATIETLAARIDQVSDQGDRQDGAITELESRLLDLEQRLAAPARPAATCTFCYCVRCGHRWMLMHDGSYPATPCPNCSTAYELPPTLRDEDRPC